MSPFKLYPSSVGFKASLIESIINVSFLNGCTPNVGNLKQNVFGINIYLLEDNGGGSFSLIAIIID